ncbi:MAG TPA: tetratricopeptide repeat protein, partial [Polyangiaceae bacterium]
MAAVALVTGVVLHTRSLEASRDVARAEALRTERTRQYLEDLFQGSELPSVKPESVRVATLVQNGIREAVGLRLSADSSLQIDMLGTLGIMSERLGNFVQADSLTRMAVARATALYGPDYPETLYQRMRHAIVLGRLNQRDSAEQQLRAIVELARNQKTDPKHPIIAEASLAMGSLLRERGQPAQALTYFQTAAELSRTRDSTSREYSQALRELGNAYGEALEFTRADSAFLRALPIVRRRYGPRHPEVAFLLSSLGFIASQQGKLDEAARYEREGVDINAAWYGPNHYLTAASKGVLAQTLIRMKQFDAGAQLSRETIDAFTRNPDLGPRSVYTAVARSTLGVALAGKGDHQGAVREYQQSYEILHAVVGDSARNTITLASRLALEIARQGYPDSAVALLRRELSISEKAYSAANPYTAQVRAHLGEALVADKKYAEAIEVTRASL